MYKLGTREAWQCKHLILRSDSFKVHPDIISSSYKNDLQFSQLELLKQRLIKIKFKMSG